MGGQGQQGRRAAPPGGALGAAQGGRQHHGVAAPGRRLAGRVCALRGMQGGAGALRPARDLHGGARPVVLRPPHRARRTNSKGNVSSAPVQVQELASSVMGRLQESCDQCAQLICNQGCQRLLDCLWRAVLARLCSGCNRKSAGTSSCEVSNCVLCTQLCTPQHLCRLGYHSRLPHEGSDRVDTGTCICSVLCCRLLKLARSAATCRGTLLFEQMQLFGLLWIYQLPPHCSDHSDANASVSTSRCHCHCVSVLHLRLPDAVWHACVVFLVRNRCEHLRIAPSRCTAASPGQQFETSRLLDGTCCGVLHVRGVGGDLSNVAMSCWATACRICTCRTGCQLEQCAT